jgi:hypothetical protein
MVGAAGESEDVNESKFNQLEFITEIRWERA